MTKTARRALPLLLPAALWIGTLPQAAASDRAPPPVEVMVGGEPALDACGGTGTVAGLKPVSGNYLAVRAGPGLGFRELDRLPAGARLWICEQRDGWLGVVYGGADTDCGVATPGPVRGPYAGPCRAGWVSETYVRPEAG